jgi:hypothetical protein
VAARRQQVAGCQWLIPIILATQEEEIKDRSLKPDPAHSSERPYLEKTQHKNRAGGVAQGEDPEFQPRYLKKK